MTTGPEQSRSWDDPEADAERLVDQMRRSIERVREQVRSYREAIRSDLPDEA